MLQIRKERGDKIFDYAATAEDWFEWWLNDKAQESVDTNQLSLFDDYEQE